MQTAAVTTTKQKVKENESIPPLTITVGDDGDDYKNQVTKKMKLSHLTKQGGYITNCFAP